MRQHFLPFSGALALFLLVYAASRFALWGLVLAAFLTYLLYLGLLRWQGRLLAKGPSRVALERLAMREAWRKGGGLESEGSWSFPPPGRSRTPPRGPGGQGFVPEGGGGLSLLTPRRG